MARPITATFPWGKPAIVAVGRLADRIAGGGTLTRPADTAGERITRDAVLRLQEDQAVRVILLQDAERPFDFAPDLDGIARQHGEGAGFDSLSPDLEAARRIVTMLQESAKPVVAAARGARVLVQEHEGGSRRHRPLA